MKPRAIIYINHVRKLFQLIQQIVRSCGELRVLFTSSEGGVIRTLLIDGMNLFYYKEFVWWLYLGCANDLKSD